VGLVGLKTRGRGLSLEEAVARINRVAL